MCLAECGCAVSGVPWLRQALLVVPAVDHHGDLGDCALGNEQTATVWLFIDIALV